MENSPIQLNDVKARLRLFACCFVFAFVLLFFLSPDSYIRDLYFRMDTAWFFICGKAWMNGMVPYVDFADSKGPLLWLIYGCGYLINHYSYVGVFWISCVFYAATFYFAYRLSRMYVSRRASLMVLAALPFFLFFKNLHAEVRAEDFCLPFVFMSLYCTCHILRGGVNARQTFHYSFAVGMSLMCCLLIKWNIMITLGGTAIVILCESLRHKSLTALWGGLAGMSAMSLPFLVYFLVQGNFDAFITEYFLYTFTTVKGGLLGNLMTCNPLRYVIFLSYLVGTVLFCHRYKISYLLLFCLFTFLPTLPAPYYYYLSIISPFSIFALIWAVGKIEDRYSLTPIVTAVACALLIFANAYNLHPEITFVFQNDNRRQHYYDVSYLMSLTKNPKVMCNPMETGVGIVANALPACKYWARQNGALPHQMDEERRMALYTRKPDFIANSKSIYGVIPPDTLKRWGYVYCGKAQGELSESPVYCKKELYRKLPHVKLRLVDLLFKRGLVKKR